MRCSLILHLEGRGDVQFFGEQISCYPVVSMLKSEIQVTALSFALLGDDADSVFISSRLGPAITDLSFLLDSPVLSESESAWVVSGELESVFCLPEL